MLYFCVGKELMWQVVTKVVVTTLPSYDDTSYDDTSYNDTGYNALVVTRLVIMRLVIMTMVKTLIGMLKFHFFVLT